MMTMHALIECDTFECAVQVQSRWLRLGRTCHSIFQTANGKWAFWMS